MCRFAFNNSKVIKILRQRGEAISAQEEKKATKYNNKLIELIENEKEQKELREPCTAYIMFEYT